jgi:hypothetical protein
MQRLCDAVWKERRDEWQAGTVVSAPSHTPLVVQQFLSSPNHHPLQILLANMGDIRSKAMTELHKIPKEAFCRGFPQWQGQ